MVYQTHRETQALLFLCFLIEDRNPLNIRVRPDSSLAATTQTCQVNKHIYTLAYL